jgi:hypothetical protein
VSLVRSQAAIRPTGGQDPTGKLAERHKLDKALTYLPESDVFVITRLSRAMRSLKHLLALPRRATRVRHRPGDPRAGHRHGHIGCAARIRGG